MSDVDATKNQVGGDTSTASWVLAHFRCASHSWQLTTPPSQGPQPPCTPTTPFALPDHRGLLTCEDTTVAAGTASCWAAPPPLHPYPPPFPFPNTYSSHTFNLCCYPVCKVLLMHRSTGCVLGLGGGRGGLHSAIHPLFAAVHTQDNALGTAAQGGIWSREWWHSLTPECKKPCSLRE